MEERQRIQSLANGEPVIQALNGKRRPGGMMFDWSVGRLAAVGLGV